MKSNFTSPKLSYGIEVKLTKKEYNFVDG